MRQSNRMEFKSILHRRATALINCMQIGRVASTVRRGERQKQKLLKRDHDSQLGFKTNCILTLSMANERLLQPDRHCEEHGNEGYFI